MSTSTKRFAAEIGIHYPLHVLNRYSLPELVGLAERAWQILGNLGFSQIWTNDNLESQRPGKLGGDRGAIDGEAWDRSDRSTEGRSPSAWVLALDRSSVIKIDRNNSSLGS